VPTGTPHPDPLPKERGIILLLPIWEKVGMRVNYTPSPCREKVGMRVNYLKKRPLAPLTLTLSPRRGELYSFSLSRKGWDEG